MCLISKYAAIKLHLNEFIKFHLWTFNISATCMWWVRCIIVSSWDLKSQSKWRMKADISPETSRKHNWFLANCTTCLGDVSYDFVLKKRNYCADTPADFTIPFGRCVYTVISPHKMCCANLACGGCLHDFSLMMGLCAI